MQDTIVGEGANVEYVITDKNVTISAGKEIKGADSFPVYVASIACIMEDPMEAFRIWLQEEPALFLGVSGGSDAYERSAL